MKLFKTYTFFATFLFLISFITVQSQINPPSGISQIEKLIKVDSIAKAQTLLDSKLTYFRSKKNYDSLVNYIELVGSYSLANGDKQKAYKNAERFVAEIRECGNPTIISLSLQNLGYLHSGTGNPKKTYDIYQSAHAFAKKSNDTTKSRLANIEYKLGYESQNFGDFQLSKKHYLKAATILDNWKSIDVEFYQQIYNALGGIMWMEAKLDSSSYYFNKSLKELSKADKNDYMNALFRPSLIKMNLSVLKNALGENQEAITLSEGSIKGFQSFIEKSTDEFRIISAKKHRTTAIENLGSYFHVLGEFKKADAVITYASNEKKKFMEPNSSGMIISRIILAQAKVGVRDFNAAKTLLVEALAIMEENPDIESYWKSGALSTLGKVYEGLGDKESAFQFFSEGNLAYKNTLQGAYNKDYFDELIDISNFYADSGYPKKALEIAKEIYNEAKKSDFKNTLQDFYHTVNLAEVSYKIKEYPNAIKYAEEALSFNLKEGNNKFVIEYRKPKALYVFVAAQYAMDKNITTEKLTDLLEKIEEGLAILETRKATIKNYEDLSLFIEENTQLFELAKKIRLHLYQKTLNEAYLDDVMSLHESAMYSRIRSRLNLRNDVLLSKIPEKIVIRERNLKKVLSKIITEESTNAIDSFFEVNSEWKTFIDSLKVYYPEYYKLHYATLEESVSEIQKYLDPKTTVVRYIFIEENLYAIVMTSTKRKIVPLEFHSVKKLITDVSSQEFEVKRLATKLHQLYQALWEPFENDILTEKVIIVPDRELFNVSFEMLTPTPIESFSEITTNSLLAKHAISYQFSLLMIKPNQHVVNPYDSNFVAFAPEFSDKMKVTYQSTIKDSVNLDEAYLKLLPQPFSVDVIKTYSRKFNGDSFLNENASKQLFKKMAGEHKIIHIGTHAESDNVSPELSRLVFAKNKSSDNYLYTYEIYNYNLASNLAILTACETGKPGYQAGEGMISLAHAFNYAGSESILTSLWEIDEESSSKIIQLFYDNISDGMPKDEALRKAKLSYIATAQGRTISPQYWAGLVLIGDTTPIHFQHHSSIWYWVLGSIVLVIILFFLFRKRASA